MNNPQPILLNNISEKKLIFLQKYVPEYINYFSKYLSELQLIINYNYIQCKPIENKINEIVQFYNELISSKYKINNIVLSNKVNTSGKKQLNTDFILYWIEKFNSLSTKIQEKINEIDNGDIKLKELSNSIGHLTFYQNMYDNNTSPYFDIFNQYITLNVPLGSTVFNKLIKHNRFNVIYADCRTNSLFKRNISNVQSQNTKEEGMKLLSVGQSLTTISHGDNLITDTDFFISYVKIVMQLNTLLSTKLGILYDILKRLNLVTNDKQYAISNIAVNNLDVEGRIIKTDLYQNVIR